MSLRSVRCLADNAYMDPAIALQGLQQAEVQLETAACRMASAGAASADGANLDVVDLRSEMVALMSAQNQFAANLATLKTADQMQKALVDIKA
ncbi:MAG TPA: flagellar basal body rod C-terminal domain-containing protein [Candidatus Sulfotelmatobacter sp.]|nr:flagellar basal body rod C-terminal domain-containing protein [Candidatus Sulfotelmatobacter sp.]